ncbi:MAG: adenosylmethionine--8-amino-7-oxononanoate transaminase [Verrucomicrobia bacterium]|nr:adenosylmethionine--8-amino-7-oxononanoate transaminase [Verrucomicrobiota bacterium]
MVWHPFTPWEDWMDEASAGDPPVIVDGQGAVLRTADGREYLDGNSSIWTNLHGHRQPRIDAAIRAQLERIAHCSFLGATHPSAVELAGQLLAAWPLGGLERVFYSDDGSTALESALRMARQYHQFRGEPWRTSFLAFRGAYHGDTLGAAGLGGIELFHGAVKQGATPPLEVVRVGEASELALLRPEVARKVAAAVIEPVLQGAAGLRLWPPGTLRALREWCDQNGVLLIADEVLTGFGRTGRMFACEHEEVVPDFLCLAKGLTGGYLPLAATLTTRAVFEAFRGQPGERRALYYGHSYTANPLGCAAALASLELFRTDGVLERVRELGDYLDGALEPLRTNARVAEIRQVGFVAGIELRNPEAPTRRLGREVCLAARRHGLLTRPIGDVVVLMLPYCVTEAQIDAAVRAIERGLAEC